MTQVLRPSRGGMQPKWVARLNRANGLVPPNTLAFSPAQGNAIRIGDPVVTVNRSGLAFGTPSSANYWRASNVKILSNLDSFTFGVVFETTVAAVTSGYTVFGERGSSGNDILKIVQGESGISNNGISVVIRNAAGTLTRLVSSIVTNDGMPHTVIVVKRAANDWRLYIDGVLAATNTTNLPGSGFTALTPLNIANDVQDSKGFSGVNLAFAMPGYSYSAAEAAALSRNPWQLFENRRRTLISVAGSAADTSLAGGLTAAGTLTGALSTSIPLSVGINAIATMAGALTTGITLGASLSAAATLAGQLSTIISLDTNMHVSSSLSGTLTDEVVPPDPRYARPSTDLMAGAWLPSSGSSLSAMLDEPSADSADFIYTESPSVCVVALNPVVDPGTSAGQVVRYQLWSATGEDVRVRFMQGATVIAAWIEYGLPATPTIFAKTLTPSECDALVPTSGVFYDLRFEFEAL